MSYAAKLVYNTHNWVAPSGHVHNGVGIHVNIGLNGYNFGMEEWLNRPLLHERNLGYLDCYRSSVHPGVADIIRLFTFHNGTVYHVGNVYGVRQLTDGEITDIRNELHQANWLGEINHDFVPLDDPRPILQHIEYQHIWTRNAIVAATGEGFMLNIEYKKLEMFERNQWRNLTAIDPQVNTKWRRISKRYNVNASSNNLHWF